MTGMTQIDVTLGTYKAIEAARLSFAESHDDIVRRILASRRSARVATQESIRQSPPAPRRRGDISVDLFGRRLPVANCKYAYLAILNALVRHKPSLFELLAHEGTARRRWVARSSEALYAGSPHLARDHAIAAHGDWFVDTNLSRRQIDQRLAIAAKLAGYRYGEDVRITEGAVANLP
jgi:hypothetical protein